MAELLGHEAGLFLPSGTMCNGIGFRLHIRPGGDEVLLHRWSHPIVAEAGGPAELAGAMVNRLDGDGGMFTAEQVEEALWPDDRYMPRSRLVSVEQTTNMGGGRVWPLEQIGEVLDVARSTRAARASRRRPPPERRGGLGRPGRGLRVRLRHRVARLLEGAGRARGRRALRLARADRRGLALEADARRGDAPGRRAGRGLPVRARPPRGAARGGPRERARAGRRACASWAWTCSRRRPTS